MILKDIKVEKNFFAASRLSTIKKPTVSKFRTKPELGIPQGEEDRTYCIDLTSNSILFTLI